MKLKSPAQIQTIKASGQILARTLQALRDMAQPGVPLSDLDDACRAMLQAEEATPAFLGYMDFPASVCLSVNEEVIHGIPSRRKLRPGDVLSIDLGVEYQGLISDSATTVALPPVKQEVQQLLQVTKQALERGIQAAQPGKRIHDISRAVFDYVKSFGYGVVRPYCGHGVGFGVHEEPQVPNYISRGANPRLKPGLVIAIEPMITLGTDDVALLDDDWTVVTTDGSISAHFEHTVAITADGPLKLTELEPQQIGKEPHENERP